MEPELSRIREIAQTVSDRRQELISALAAIAACQRDCTHTWNPVIPGGSIDGRDVQVCRRCGVSRFPDSAGENHE